MQKLESQIDKSVNFVEQQLTGFIESRYVRKCDDYFICYLSSQTGCNRGCKFCHLTATGQTSFDDVTYAEFAQQVWEPFKQYRESGIKAKYVHFNFMARGEPLVNPWLHYAGHADGVLSHLGALAMKFVELPSKFNISTIMPLNMKRSLLEFFPIITPTIYYSLYSVNDTFRKEWLPAALPVNEALRQLKEYQDFSKKIVKIHHTFIRGQNDSVEEVYGMLDAIDKVKLVCEFNLVRYNPFSSAQGQESEEHILARNVRIISEHLTGKVQIIPRVGYDVKASCGMFVDKEDG